MSTDIRFPIGLLFSLFGLILVLFGLWGDPSRYRQSLGVNVNLIWGVVLLHFGLLMLGLARRRQRISQKR